MSIKSHHLIKFIFYFSLIFFLYSSNAESDINELENILNKTNNFFEKLKIQFGSLPSNNKTWRSIDTHINKYLEKITEKKDHRSKRQLYHQNDYETDFEIFNGFKTLPNYNISGATDVHFFIMSSRTIVKLVWFIATVNPDGISFLQFNGDAYILVFSFPLKNGKLILTDSREFSTLLIIQQYDGIISILRLTMDADNKLLVSTAPTLPTLGSRHAAIWIGMNQLYLGVSFSKIIKIYKWLGENFDQIQVLDFGAKNLIPFQMGSSMILAATGNKTRIVSFQLKTNNFIVIQELPGSDDATGFHLENGYFGDNFLILTGAESTIIYKERKHKYIPFQRLQGANKVQVLSSDQKVLLFLIEKIGGMKVFQNDGWKFTDLKIYLPQIIKIYPTFLPDRSFVLIMKSIDDDQWIFHRMIWRTIKTSKTLNENLRSWCEASLAYISEPPTIPELKQPLVITKAQIQYVSASYINGYSAEEFVNVTKIYKKILSQLYYENTKLEDTVSLNNPVFENFSAKRIEVMSRVIVNNTRVKLDQEFFDRFRIPDHKHKNITLKHVKTGSLNGFRCPVPAIKYSEVHVIGSINGILFNSFVNDTLKTYAQNQIVTGNYSFDSLKIQDGQFNLDVIGNTTRQELKFTNLTIDELTLPSGLFVPLNGEEVTVTGNLTASRVKTSGLIHLRGPVRGPNATKFSPFIHVTEPLSLENDYVFNNVKIVSILKAHDFADPNGTSYREIMKNSIPLDSEEIPIHMKFSSKNIEWENVTLNESFGNWITTNHSGLNITGTKVSKNLTLLDHVYDILPVPVISGRVCTKGIMTSDVYLTNFTVNNAVVDFLIADNVFGALEIDKTLSDSVKKWNEVPWELKSLTGQVMVKNATISAASEFDLPGLHESMSKWSQPGVLKGSIRVKNLSVKNLITAKGFINSIPKTIKRFEALRNLKIEEINGTNIPEFLHNVVKIDESTSLTNITFLTDLFVSKIVASNTNIPFLSNLNRNLGSKTITSGLITQNLILPDLLPLPSAEVPVQFVINGNIIFINEPIITNINNIYLEELSEDIWMKNKPATFTGKFLFFKNVSFENSVNIVDSLDTPKFGPWSEISSRIFSKTRDQEIDQKIIVSSLEVINITGSEQSKIISSPSTNLYELEHDTLKKVGSQEISSSWSFEKIIIQDKMEINGLINDLNLNHDVVRNDVEKNVISGRIIVDTLTTQNLDGYKFDEFARNTLKTTKQEELIVIKGKKTFSNLNVEILNLSSTLKGKYIENCLLKHSEQIISGKKIIKGNLEAPGIKTDGLINDVNLTKILDYQLKKNSSLQIIETPIVLQKSLNILGNLTIDKLLLGVNLTNLESHSENSLIPTKMDKLNKFGNLVDFAKELDYTLQQGVYQFDKLKLVEKNSTPIIELLIDETVNFNSLGICKIREFFLHCNSRDIFDFSKILDTTQILKLKLVSLDNRNLLICITSAPNGGITIYSVREENIEIVKEKELQVPDVIKGSVKKYMKSIFIVVQLKEYTMVLRYEPWNEFKEYVLPKSEHFNLNNLSNELLLFRNDGVWGLGGVAAPKLIFKANLKGKIDIFENQEEFYMQLNEGNITNLLKVCRIEN